MRFLVALLLWSLLLVLCWPLALLLLVLWPVLWLLSIPFRIVGALLSALVAFVKALLFLPARLREENGASANAARHARLKCSERDAETESNSGVPTSACPPASTSPRAPTSLPAAKVQRRPERTAATNEDFEGASFTWSRFASTTNGAI
jgi:hypothetical protein